MQIDKIKIIDFHSHILPGIDDGSDSVETSKEMLCSLKEQGVDTVVATPHYYNFRGSIEQFLENRKNAYDNLSAYLGSAECDVPDLLLGAEVRLYPDLWCEENLDALCIEKTKTILIEMPYEKWSDWMINAVYAVISKGYRVVLAHLERYDGLADKKKIFQGLLGMDVYVQCNTESFITFSKRHILKKLIKTGRITVIGTDCHNMDTRRPYMRRALEKIEKKYGNDIICDLMQNAEFLTKPLIKK